MAKTIHGLIRSMHRVFGFTAMVSHEIPEIFALFDWVAMLKHGKIIAMVPSKEFLKLEDPTVREFIFVNEEGVA